MNLTQMQVTAELLVWWPRRWRHVLAFGASVRPEEGRRGLEGVRVELEAFGVGAAVRLTGGRLE